MDPVKTCALCPKLCRFLCPVASGTGDESAVPTQMASLILLQRAGTMRYDPETTHPLYRCTGCLACQVPCEFDIDVPAYLEGERITAWSAGAAPRRVVEVADRVAAGHPPDDRAGHHADLDGPRFEGEGTVFWPGCALTGADPVAAERTRRLLERVLDEPVRYPPATAPACCGDPLRAAGDHSRYLAHRATLGSALRGAARVVTGCACCLQALPHGAVHVSDLLGFSWDGPVTGRAVAYHDPCHTARPEDRSGTTRALLAACSGEPVVEFVDRGRETGCCGAGDSFALFFPDEGDRVAASRLRDPAVAEAGTVVTACSRCAAHLQASAPDGVAVLDLGDYLYGIDVD